MEQEPKIKPGTICYATNKCLEQFLKAGLWSSKKDLLMFISGNGSSKEVKEVFRIFKDRPGDYKIEVKNDDRFILVTDYENFSSNVFGIDEQFIVLGFLHPDKTYYSYLHCLYENLLDEYLPKIL